MGILLPVSNERTKQPIVCFKLPIQSQAPAQIIVVLLVCFFGFELNRIVLLASEQENDMANDI